MDTGLPPAGSSDSEPPTSTTVDESGTFHIPSMLGKRRCSSPSSDSSFPFRIHHPSTRHTKSDSYIHRLTLLDPASRYPSPPSTSSDQKRSVPLPVSPLTSPTGPSDSPSPLVSLPLPMGMPPLSPPPTTLRQPCDLPVAEASVLCDAERLLPSSSVPGEDPRRRGSQLLSPLSTDWSQHRRISDVSEDPDHHDSSMLLCPLPLLRPQLDHVRIHAVEVDPPTLQWSSWPNQSPSPSAQSLMFVEDANHHASLLPGYYQPHDHRTNARCIHEDEKMDVDDQPVGTRPLWHPPISPLSDLDDDQDSLPSPGSPYWRDLTELPELDDPEEYPDSPSLRTFTDLPDAPMDIEHEHARDWSPTPTLLSLPGADTDDELLPVELGPPKIYDKYSGSIFADLGCSNSSAGLLLADPDLVPIPDSPPVENLDIDVALLSQDPLLRHLSVIRKKSQSSERQLRQLETQMLEQGAVHARAHVRQERRKHKEKFREITALIRLNMGDEVFNAPPSSEDHASLKAKSVTSKDQLVARMILKRHENFRPLSVRKCISLDPLASQSPLSRFPVQTGEMLGL